MLGELSTIWMMPGTRRRNLSWNFVWKSVIVDGRNVIGSDEFIEEGFVYKGIGRGDKNGHDISDNFMRS